MANRGDHRQGSKVPVAAGLGTRRVAQLPPRRSDCRSSTCCSATSILGVGLSTRSGPSSPGGGDLDMHPRGVDHGTTPVSTAQPNRAASSSSSSGSIFASECRETVANSAKPETPRWCCTGVPSARCSRRAAWQVPAPFTAAPGSHKARLRFRARAAMAAGRDESAHHEIAPAEVGDPWPDFLDDAGRFMAEAPLAGPWPGRH